MSPKTNYHFYGDENKAAKPSHEDALKTPEPYVASKELICAVNLAIYLRRPLLLEGEAGCGKTRLARAVAYELGLPFYSWYIHSTSKAREGLYHYDAILRLHDVQVQQKMSGSEIREVTPGRNPNNPSDYLRFDALGKAFQLKDQPAVVLIDEIDKADIDFPNDLLSVLDDHVEFEIHETGEKITVPPENKPIVIITSNKEKGNLPTPFLRRCIYFFLEFPDDERLKKIVACHYRNRKDKLPDKRLLDSALKRFGDLRREGGLHKNPSTSEFLDWLEALHHFQSKPYNASQLNSEKNLPYPELLFKLRPDWQRNVSRQYE